MRNASVSPACGFHGAMPSLRHRLDVVEAVEQHVRDDIKRRDQPQRRNSRRAVLYALAIARTGQPVSPAQESFGKHHRQRHLNPRIVATAHGDRIGGTASMVTPSPSHHAAVENIRRPEAGVEKHHRLAADRFTHRKHATASPVHHPAARLLHRAAHAADWQVVLLKPRGCDLCVFVEEILKRSSQLQRGGAGRWRRRPGHGTDPAPQLRGPHRAGMEGAARAALVRRIALAAAGCGKIGTGAAEARRGHRIGRRHHRLGGPAQRALSRGSGDPGHRPRSAGRAPIAIRVHHEPAAALLESQVVLSPCAGPDHPAFAQHRRVDRRKSGNAREAGWAQPTCC